MHSADHRFLNAFEGGGATVPQIVFVTLTLKKDKFEFKEIRLNKNKDKKVFVTDKHFSFSKY